MTRDGAVVKLGGSIVTYKRTGRREVRREVVARLARELAAARVRPLVVVHGAGSFGHRIVQRTGIDRSVRGPGGLNAWSEAQLAQNDLNLRLTRILLDAGLPAFACQPTGMVLLRGGRLRRLWGDALERLVAQGLVPVLFGVPAFDEERDCAILSGDTLAPAVAWRLGIGRVVHCTDVDGVYTADPAADPGARRIETIDRRNRRRVERLLGESRSVDVTGGMRGKVTGQFAWAKRGVVARIIDATRPGSLLETLRGKGGGTTIRW